MEDSQQHLTAIVVSVLVMVSFSPSITGSISAHTLSRLDGWEYVGGDGPGNYSTIQAAVDNASPQDTIIIYPGTYEESLILPIPLHLQGIETPLIETLGDYTVLIDAEGCSLNNLAFMSHGTCLQLHYNNTSITHCSVLDSLDDLRTYENSSRNIIANNSFYGHATALTFIESDYNIISDNIIGPHGWGLITLYDESDHNLIQRNTIAASELFSGIDNNIYSSDNKIIDNTIVSENRSSISIESGKNLTIVGNILSRGGLVITAPLHDVSTYLVENNTLDGRPISVEIDKTNMTIPTATAQVILYNCSTCEVRNLNLSAHPGIRIVSCRQTQIHDNHLASHGGDWDWRNGIDVTDSTEILIANNSISNYIRFEVVVKNSKTTTITNNDIALGDIGINCQDDSNCLIQNNTISSCDEEGIFASGALTLCIDHNYITKSTIGIQAQGKHLQIDNNTLIVNNLSLLIQNARDVHVKGNAISDSLKGGASVEETVGIEIRHNTFISNHGFGLNLWKSHVIAVKENNLILNFLNVVCINTFPCWWKGNYWNPRYWRGPKLILEQKLITLPPSYPHGPGRDLSFPWLNIDLHPAKNPL